MTALRFVRLIEDAVVEAEAFQELKLCHDLHASTAHISGEVTTGGSQERNTDNENGIRRRVGEQILNALQSPFLNGLRSDRHNVPVVSYQREVFTPVTDQTGRRDNRRLDGLPHHTRTPQNIADTEERFTTTWANIQQRVLRRLKFGQLLVRVELVRHHRVIFGAFQYKVIRRQRVVRSAGINQLLRLLEVFTSIGNRSTDHERERQNGLSQEFTAAQRVGAVH